MPPDSPAPPPSAPRCPVCRKPADPRHRPFCSARCATIDLGRWLKGNYRIPTEEPVEEGERGERDRD
ncbi:MAG: DNA gyrase inhibitor YacG [Stellaceae bacterium]